MRLWRAWNIEPTRYILCGFAATIVDASSLWLLISCQIHYLLAVTLAFATGVTTAYILSVKWVFVGYERFRADRELIIFVMINLCSLALSLEIIYLVGELQLVLAKLTAIVVSATVNFTAKKLILFRKPLK